MPTVSVLLDEVDKTIHTRIESKIINDISSAIKLPKDILLIKHGESDLVITDVKGNRDLPDTPNTPTTNSKKRIIVSVSNDYEEDDLLTGATHQEATYPVFLDNDIGVKVYPIYVKNVLKLEFSYTSNSKSEVKRVRDHIRLSLSRTRNILIHQVDYTIVVPKQVEELITDVYDIKSVMYPQTLENYFEENATNRMHLITDMANEGNKRLAISERQTRIVGKFSLDGIPDKVEMDNDNGNYKLSFEYEVTMDIPRAMVMRYPVMFCNQILPAKYLDWISENKNTQYDEDLRSHNYTSIHNYNLSMLESHRMVDSGTRSQYPIVIPDFDDFHQKRGHKGYTVIASFLTTVNEDDKKGLLDLVDIGEDYQLSKEVLSYLKDGEYRYVTTPYSSFLYVGLWQEGRFYDAPALLMDSDLNISSIKEIDYTKPVRVTISLITDITGISPRAIARMNDRHLTKTKDSLGKVTGTSERSIIEVMLSEFINIRTLQVADLNVKDVEFDMTLRSVVGAMTVLIVKQDIISLNRIMDRIKTDGTDVYSKLVIYLRDNSSQTLRSFVEMGILPDLQYDKLSGNDVRHTVVKPKRSNDFYHSVVIIPLVR